MLIWEERDSQKSEDNLAMSEAELDKQTHIVSDLTRKVDELQTKADEAARLKDQLDEYVLCVCIRPVTEGLLGIGMLRTNCRRQRMLWRNTRRNSRRVPSCGSKSGYATLPVHKYLPP